MTRTKLSALPARLRHGVRLASKKNTFGYPMLAFIASNGRTLFTVSPDDLFDADGNRFEDDLQ